MSRNFGVVLGGLGILKRRILSKDIFVKANDINVLSVLRNPSSGVNDLMKDRVAQFHQGVLDRLPRATAIMRLQILNILQ